MYFYVHGLAIINLKRVLNPVHFCFDNYSAKGLCSMKQYAGRSGFDKWVLTTVFKLERF